MMQIPIEEIKTLVDLMVTHDMSRIELTSGDSHILLRRGQPIITSQVVSSAAPVAVATAPAPSASAPTEPLAPAAPAPAANEVVIKSPMVGTFYVSPDPDSPAFVNLGDVVKPETVVCLVEAMKVFNEIKAEVSGRITRILVKNAQAVEFDQPLFAVSPA
ncbi:MAG: acetyl-CoA carboxylase biotin carboxyl carrier protein [Phycisphaerales bacterium]|nr:acetyl-CoA carboxylase biotin carboxyl carrier protein [Phycisphaerales bacterium]